MYVRFSCVQVEVQCSNAMICLDRFALIGDFGMNIKGATSIGGMLGFGPTLQLTDGGFCLFLEVYQSCVRLEPDVVAV
jgi:hypothetical protein